MGWLWFCTPVYRCKGNSDLLFANTHFNQSQQSSVLKLRRLHSKRWEFENFCRIGPLAFRQTSILNYVSTYFCKQGLCTLNQTEVKFPGKFLFVYVVHMKQVHFAALARLKCVHVKLQALLARPDRRVTCSRADGTLGLGGAIALPLEIKPFPSKDLLVSWAPHDFIDFPRHYDDNK